MLFTGWLGIAVSLGVFGVLWLWVSLRTQGQTFQFERGTADFERMLTVYLDISKFILTLAAGGIVLIISSTALGGAPKKLPPDFASPLLILLMSIFYGILFMPLLALDYESYRNAQVPYTRLSYIRNQTLGFSSLACFCLGYGWLIFAAVRG